MTSRAFIVLLILTMVGIYFGDRVADDFAAPGMERTFAVFVITGAIVLPAAWLLEKIGWIRGGLDLSRKRTDAARSAPRDGGAA